MENSRTQRIIVLGSGPALSSATRDNTSFLFDSFAGSLFVDCSGSPFHKLQKIGVDPERLRGVILTHAHSDHMYGLTSLVHELWLLGRRETLQIYANARTQKVAKTLLDVFKLREKPVPLEFHLIPDEQGFLLLENDSYLVHTSPVRHEIPTAAVKITSRLNERVVVYSADTGPCQELITLARGADLLLQECSVEEEHPFHCTPEQAGEIAGGAEVGEVVLVHCHHNLVKEPYVTIALIEKHFHGPVRFAQDLDVYDL